MKHPRLSPALLIGLLLCLGASGAAPQPPATPTVPAPVSQVGASSIVPTAPAALNIEGFNLVSPTAGWLLADQHLYWTTTGGQSWEDISPWEAQALTPVAVTFLDAASGWVILTGSGADGQPVYVLAQTADAGHTWQSHPLSLFAPGEVPAEAAAVYLQVTDAHTGWLVVKQASGSNFSLGTLFGTRDGGQTWLRLPLPIGDPVYFSSPLVGWTAGGVAGDQFFRTQDGGQTWSAQTPAGLMGAQPLYHLPVFKDAQSGVLPVITTLGGQSQVEFHVTADGGQTWPLAAQVPLDSPSAPGAALPLSILDAQHWTLIEPHAHQLNRMSESGVTTTVLSDPLAAHIDSLDMVTPDTGWAEYLSNNCTRTPEVSSSATSLLQVSCHKEIKLLDTTDGGQNWAILPLPSALALVSTADTSFAAQAEPNSAGNLSAQSRGSLTQALTGQGFDICTIPTEAQLLGWSTQSPYTAVNLYIGGSSRACANTALTASLLRDLALQGWRFIPTWVGPQASCSALSSRMSSDANTAYGQGIKEADAALTAAANLGLTLSDNSGTIIYYDLENFSYSNGTCLAAAQSFISGWSGELHARSNQAGLYGGACGSDLKDFAGIGNVPDNIWAAAWNLVPQYDPNASVYGLACLSNSLWINHQRLRQYAGDHAETWGAVSLAIDSDALDGIVASLNPSAPVVATQIYLAYVNSPFRDFQVLISSLDNGSPIAAYDLQYRDLTVTTNWTDAMTNTTSTAYAFVGLEGHTYDFRARARDLAGYQSGYMGNSEHAIPLPCPVPTDSNYYEPDDTLPTARPITPDGSFQIHYIETAGDQDWVKFTAVAGQRYTLATNNLGGFADTVIELFNASGQSLAYNDDDPANWPASRIWWQAPASDAYYLKVTHFDVYAYGCFTQYSVMVAPTLSTFLPLMLRR